MRWWVAVGVRSPRPRLGAGIVRMPQLAVEDVHVFWACSGRRMNQWGWLRGADDEEEAGGRVSIGS